MNKTVSLALSAGGARGYAHIGVIEVLEERGFKIKAISGSSMGAVVGGIYGTGKLNLYKDWVTSLSKLDVVKMLDLSFSKKGLFKGDKIINFLEKLIGDIKIEDLSIDFTAVAVDIVKQKEVWFSKGSLFEALRASIAIPWFFTPLEKDKMILLDGGLLNPLPITPLLHDNTDLVIAVDVNSNKPKDFSYVKEAKDDNMKSKLNFFQIFSTSISIMQNTISRFKLANYSPDLIIEISKDYCDVFDFHKANELIEIGRIIANQKINSLEQLTNQ
jgi:NTE family protein